MARKPERRDLFPGALEMMILHSLRLKPMHGYALVKHIQQISDDLLQVEEGSLYPALQRMLREGWLKPEADYPRFKAQLERVPVDQLPEDRRFNPLALNPYVLYKALPQVKRYSQAELIAAMELLFQCNQRLVSSGLDESLVLQQALVQIVASKS